MRILFIGLIGLISVGLCVTAFSQVNSGKHVMKSIEGEVVAIDWVGSTLTVRWMQSDTSFDETTFFVPDSAKITKGAETISFADIEQSDKVVIEYYDASPGPLTVVSLIVYI